MITLLVIVVVHSYRRAFKRTEQSTKSAGFEINSMVPLVSKWLHDVWGAGVSRRVPKFKEKYIYFRMLPDACLNLSEKYIYFKI